MTSPQKTIESPDGLAGQSLGAAQGSAPDVRVEMTHLRSAMAYLAIIESVPLEEILWIEDGKAIPVTPAEIAEWKLTGLNNRDFALILLEGKKAQNAKLCNSPEAARSQGGKGTDSK